MKNTLFSLFLALLTMSMASDSFAQVATGGNRLNERINAESINAIRFKQTEKARKESFTALDEKIAKKNDEFEAIVKRLKSFCSQLGKSPKECTLLDPTKDLKCWAKESAHCTLSEKVEGKSTGSCKAGYGGACSYKCTDVGWSKRANSCNPLTITKKRNQKRPGGISSCGTPACGVASDVGKVCYQRFCAHRYLGHCDDHDYWIRRCETCVNGKSSISGHAC